MIYKLSATKLALSKNDLSFRILSCRKQTMHDVEASAMHTFSVPYEGGCSHVCSALSIGLESDDVKTARE